MVPEDRPAASRTGYWKQWFRLVLALGWLLLAATISFVPGRRRPAGDLPRARHVAWLICSIVLIGAALLAIKVG
jgi:hypothetical protein